MLQMFRNKKGQGTAEFAVTTALVIGGVIAMQQYVQRGFQGRMRDATTFLRDETGAFGNTLQYEPYYVNQSAQVDRDSSFKDAFDEQVTTETRTRQQQDFIQRTEYNSAVGVDNTGVSPQEAGAGL